MLIISVFKQILKKRLTGFDLGKLLTVLGVDKEHLAEEKVVLGGNLENTIAEMIAEGDKLIPKKHDDRFRKFLVKELEHKFLEDKKVS